METVIDWSEWPVDSEIWLPNQPGTAACVVRFSEDGAAWYAYSKTCPWTEWVAESKFSILERFKYISKAWDGSGLPPVGAVCEMSLFASNKWELCHPVHYLEQPIDHSDQVVVYQDSLGGEVCYILDPPCSGSIEFRPIRTPEQIAADERASAIAELIHGHSNEVLREWAAYVYDTLGYRKQVSK